MDNQIIEAEQVETTTTTTIKRTFDELCEMGRQAHQQSVNSQWIIGDLACVVEKEYGTDAIGRFANEIRVDKSTVMRYRTVSKAWPKELREKFKNPDGDYVLPHRHFQMLAGREDRVEWIDKAHENMWSTKQLEVELMKKEGKFDKKLAIANILLVRGEFEEILKWYNLVSIMKHEAITEFSQQVMVKVKKAYDRSIGKTKEELEKE